MQIERIDQTTAHHHPPKSVCDVSRKLGSIASCQRLGKFTNGTEFQDARRLRFFIRRDRILLTFLLFRNLDLKSKGEPRAGHFFFPFENRLEGNFLEQWVFTDGWKFDVLPQHCISDECVQPLIVNLFVILYK